jgi:hypothetical protein
VELLDDEGEQRKFQYRNGGFWLRFPMRQIKQFFDAPVAIVPGLRSIVHPVRLVEDGRRGWLVVEMPRAGKLSERPRLKPCPYCRGKGVIEIGGEQLRYQR